MKLLDRILYNAGYIDTDPDATQVKPIQKPRRPASVASNGLFKKTDNEARYCIACGSSRVVKNGTKDGLQKLTCKACKRHWVEG